MQTQEVLAALRGAARELATPSNSRPGTPTAAAAGAAGGAADPPPSTANLLLQLSAMHKAFLALSEAFTEQLDHRQAEQEEQRQALQSVRRECAGKFQVAAALHEEVTQQGYEQAALVQRCAELEQEVASLRQQLEQRQAEAAADLQAQVEQAVARQLAAAQHQWQGQRLPALLEPVRDAVQATAELAAGVAADMAGLAGDVKQLADWCNRIEAAHANHEQRLRLTEEGSPMAAAAGAAAAGGAPPPAVPGPPAPASTATLLQQQQQQQQWEQQAPGGALQQSRQQHQHQQVHYYHHQQQQQGQQQEQQGQQALPLLQQQLQEVLLELGSLSLAAAELPAVQQQLAVVADQQAQQAKTTEELVQSVLADVTALARHTRSLDKEVRGLRSETQQTQEALLRSCSAFSKALSMPSPVGPFTSLPPQLPS